VTPEDDEWDEPEPWGWRGVSVTIVVIVITAIVLHYFGVLAPKPRTAVLVTQFKLPQTNEYCHPAKFYYTGYGWTCAR